MKCAVITGLSATFHVGSMSNYMVKDRYENGRRVKSGVVHFEEEESDNESDMGIHGSEVKLR